MSEALIIFLTGAGTGAGLIIAIGAQNAFVLTQGIRREHAVSVATCCALIDIILINAGVAGLGRLIESRPLLGFWAAVLGAIFLFAYGSRSFRSAFKPNVLVAEESRATLSRSAAISTVLALSLLNPHVYLDTVILLGSIAGQYGESGKWVFALGASIASIIWFYSLAFGAAFLAPWFAKPKAWQILDGLIALVMFAIALALAKMAIGQYALL